MARFTAATNDQSILSKASAVKLGYWKDDLLLPIVPRVKVLNHVVVCAFRFEIADYQMLA